MSIGPQAEVYNDSSDHQKEDGLKLLSLSGLEDGMKVLDLGCGTGQLSSVLADRVGDTGNVIGIDPDTARIKIANENYSSVQNITFQNGSAEDIPGNGCSYNAVFSNYVLHWVEDKERAFQNVYRSLKPSGVFAVTFETSLSEFLSNYIEMLEPNQRKKLKSKMFFTTADEVEQMAISCGFTMQHRVETNRIAQFKNFDEFVRKVYAGFGGLADPDLMDAEKLKNLRRNVPAGW